MVSVQVTVVSLVGGAVYWLASKAGVGRLAALGTLGVVLGLTVTALSPWPSWLVTGQTPLWASSHTTSAGHDSTGEHEGADGSGGDVAGALHEPDGPFNSIY